MKNKIAEVLAYIVKELKKNISPEDISKRLYKKKKFDSETIEAAFSIANEFVLSDTIYSVKNIDFSTRKNFRILTEEEKDIIGIDNYNYLLELLNSGAMNSLELNNIIDNLSILPQGQITKEEINFLLLLSLVDIHELKSGEKLLMLMSDSIN